MRRLVLSLLLCLTAAITGTAAICVDTDVGKPMTVYALEEQEFSYYSIEMPPVPVDFVVSWDYTLTEVQSAVLEIMASENPDPLPPNKNKYRQVPGNRDTEQSHKDLTFSSSGGLPFLRG